MASYSGLLGGLEIARRALSAHQAGLSTTGHNIANANTPGFSRQQVELEATMPMSSPNGQVGTGVNLVRVRRLRDAFLDTQFRQETHSFGRGEISEQTLEHVEVIFNEPSEWGLGNALGRFWESFEELANQPENTAARVNLKEQTDALTGHFNQLDGQLKALRRNVDDTIRKKIEEINEIASGIARLNEVIAGVELNGTSANDLRDQQDLLLDQLSKMADIQTFDQSSGSVTVKIGALGLVEHSEVNRLLVDPFTDDGMSLAGIVFEEGRIPAMIRDGELKGLLEARDDVIPVQLDGLNTLAAELVSAVNELHRGGYGLDGSTGVDFFNPDGVTAQTIALSSQIVADGNKIAASSDGTLGSNGNALAIGALRFERRLNGGGATFDDYYNSMVGTLGIRSREAQNVRKSQELLINQLDNRRESVKGVSIDEEVTNLIRYQHAYQAAARMITVMDEALDLIINRMGAR